MTKSKQPLSPSPAVWAPNRCAMHQTCVFATVQDAQAHIKENKLKITERSHHARGYRINVVDRKGQATHAQYSKGEGRCPGLR